MKEFAKKIITYFTVIILIICLVIFCLDFSLPKGTYKKTQWLNSVNNQSYDYVILGNSRVVNSMDVLDLNVKSNLKGLNIAMDGSNLSDFNLLLRLFLSNNNKTKHLIIEIDRGALEETKSKREYLFTPFRNKLEIKDYFKDKKLTERILLPLNYFKFNFDIGLSNACISLIKPKYTSFDVSGSKVRTEKYRDNSRLASYDYPEPLPEDFLKLIAYARKHVKKITIITAPYFNVSTTDLDKRIRLKANLKELKLEYKDFTELYLLNKKYFLDNRHLNDLGAKEFNKELLSVIKY